MVSELLVRCFSFQDARAPTQIGTFSERDFRVDNMLVTSLTSPTASPYWSQYADFWLLAINNEALFRIRFRAKPMGVPPHCRCLEAPAFADMRTLTTAAWSWSWALSTSLSMGVEYWAEWGIGMGRDVSSSMRLRIAPGNTAQI